MKIGDKVLKQLNYGAEGGSFLPPREGTVVYIHPERLYCVIEFEFESRGGPVKIRESYPMRTRQVVETAEDELSGPSWKARPPGYVSYPRFRANYLEADQAKNRKKKGKKPK